MGNHCCGVSFWTQKSCVRKAEVKPSPKLNVQNEVPNLQLTSVRQSTPSFPSLLLQQPPACMETHQQKSQTSNNMLKDLSKHFHPCPALSKFFWCLEQTLETQALKDCSSSICISISKIPSLRSYLSPVLIPMVGRAHSDKTGSLR